MSEQEFRRALGYANSALDLLKRATIPPYPQFYELLYTYATGINPALNARINAIFRDGNPTADVAERLYNEFLRAQDANERISGVSQRMSNRIVAIHDAIDTAMTTASAYSASLQVASGDLGSEELDATRLRTLANALLAETRRMQDANHQLEQNLAASRDDIEALQRDLDDVRREALLDPLTKVYNRKAFDDGLLRAVGRAQEHGDHMCLMLIDIDHFKSVNDTFGHQAGDECLVRLATLLKINTRESDVVCRWGGDEFLVLLPTLPREAALERAETYRKAFERLPMPSGSEAHRATLSIGVACYPDDANSADALIAAADAALYRAKQHGRNRVEHPDESAARDPFAA